MNQSYIPEDLKVFNIFLTKYTTNIIQYNLFTIKTPVPNRKIYILQHSLHFLLFCFKFISTHQPTLPPSCMHIFLVFRLPYSCSSLRIFNSSEVKSFTSVSLCYTLLFLFYFYYESRHLYTISIFR